MVTQGIVRAARRPPGWTPPGPPPQPPRDARRLGPRPGEDLCYLSGDWRILQRLDGHRWSLDDLVTAWVAAGAAAPCGPAHLVDLGCGIGAVLLMLAWRFPRARALGVEAQAVSIDLARRSLAWNGVGDRCEVRLGDLRDAALVPEGPVFELLTGTPPYLGIGTAIESERPQKGACNFEQRGGIEAYCDAAARLLAPAGAFVVCEQAAQDARVHRAAAAAGLAVTRTLGVIPRAGKAPLFSVHTLRHAGWHEEPPRLVVRDRHGEWTRPFRAVRADMGLPP